MTIIKEVTPVFTRTTTGRLKNTTYRLVWMDNLSVPVLLRRGQTVPSFTCRAKDKGVFLVKSEHRNRLVSVPDETTM